MHVARISLNTYSAFSGVILYPSLVGIQLAPRERRVAVQEIHGHLQDAHDEPHLVRGRLAVLLLPNNKGSNSSEVRQ